MIKADISPLLTKEDREELEAKFWRSIEKKGKDDCWEWTGNQSSYPLINIREKHRLGMYSPTRKYTTRQKIHRVSWLIHHGSLPPKGLLCCHSCDNRKCANPNHLWVGTYKQNTHDMIRKGRAKGIAALANLNKKVSTWKNISVSPDQPGMTKLP
jgi:hypothetical protein